MLLSGSLKSLSYSFDFQNLNYFQLSKEHQLHNKSEHNLGSYKRVLKFKNGYAIVSEVLFLCVYAIALTFKLQHESGVLKYCLYRVCMQRNLPIFNWQHCEIQHQLGHQLMLIDLYNFGSIRLNSCIWFRILGADVRWLLPLVHC